MKKIENTVLFYNALCMIMAVSAFPMTVNADMGPKASVRFSLSIWG